MAAASATCPRGTGCTIGEFLYSDTSTPIASASCQLTSYAPNGATFLNNVPLTGTGDGWYGYQAAIPEDAQAGFYPTHLCCQTTENDLCIDKSFNVDPPATPVLTTNDIANAVWNATQGAYQSPDTFGAKVNSQQNLSADSIWNFPSRSLTSIQNIIAGIWGAPTVENNAPGTMGEKVNSQNSLTANDVWAYSNRSVNSFGDIINSIWTYNSRSLSSVGNIISPPDTTTTAGTATLSPTLQQDVKESRQLLEKLANNPTVSTYMEEDPGPKLDSKLNRTKDYLTQIAANSELASSKLGVITLKWDLLSDSDVTAELQNVIDLLGKDEGDSPKTIIGQLKWLDDAWAKPVMHNLYTDTSDLRDQLSEFKTSLAATPKGDDQLSSLTKLYGKFTIIKATIGDMSNGDTDPSLFGVVKALRALADSLNNQYQTVTNLLSNWEATPVPSQQKLASTLSQSALSINQLTGLNTIINPNDPPKTTLDNTGVLLNLNRTLLAQKANEPVKGSWISEDAMIFHVLVHNPSKTLRQTAAINFHLPPELAQDSITSVDPLLKVDYDPTTQSLKVTGNVDLPPRESKLLDIKTVDIWQINPDEIDSLRKQAAELIKPLEKTSFYAQGTTIKSNIDVALDTVTQLRNQATSPAIKIQVYQKAAILMKDVKAQMGQLQNLVSQAQNSGSLMGFIGGVQAVAVWGIIIIFIAGFIFLSLYMRTLYLTTNPAPAVSGNLPLSLPLTKLPNQAPIGAWSASPVLTASVPLISLPTIKFSISKQAFNISVIVFSVFTVTLLASRHIPKQAPHKQTAVVAPATPKPASPASGLTITPKPSPASNAGWWYASPTPLAVSQLDINPSPSPAASALTTYVIITPPDADTPVNVRTEPSSTSTKVTSIPSSETVLQLDESASPAGEWVHVKLVGRTPQLTGWVRSEYVSPASQ